MKIYLCILLLIIPLFVCAQQVKSADGIIGTWWTSGKESTVEIYKVGNEYQGRITWLKVPLDENGLAKADPKNPKAELRNRKRLGMVIMVDSKAKEANVLTGGTIYDPKSGNTYKCTIKLKDKNTLELRGFVGVSLLGRTETWMKAK